MKRFALALALILSTHRAEADCKSWFDDTKIKRDKSCLDKCVIAPIDLGTFNCHEECDSLCRVAKAERFLFQISDLYPGLNPAERALISQYPAELLEAYKLSWQAEGVCLKQFPRSDRNDASDACRHFVWAAQLTQKLGDSLAQKILDAHEQEPSQAMDEKAMDLANNQRGVTFARSKASSLTVDAIVAEFQTLLKDGKLVTLEEPQ